MNEVINFLHQYQTVITVIVIAVVAILFDRLLRLSMNKFFGDSSRALRADFTKYILLKNAVSFIIFMVATGLIVYNVPSLRKISLTLFAGAGIFAAIIGFASQQAFSNIISGIFIVIFKPFRVGDVVNIGPDRSGIIEDITLRHTVIRSWQNRRIIIPNSIISAETIVNSSILEELTCEHAEIGISYYSDIETACSTIEKLVAELPNYIDARTDEEKKEGDPLVRTRVIRYDDSAIIIRAYLWANDPVAAFILKTEYYRAIKKRFDEVGVEIPFPHRTIVMKEPKADEKK
ncbi:mechanosensitive ion channel family protein [Salibacter halophilus]|uniref:Mechanosensitive ion channel family protein n=1 Tax=Salibacter halophilus TaxID=1803916 RepID=A0A6N6MAI9_9FLAO|nr:mechanosensitive ion channel family protein [Salibacter halophilus]KAB1066009.1 mechanosensitive ion channel family protein [Salibacter halophilus]